MLRAHLKKRGRGEAARIARECGVDLSLPGRWARGDKNPDADTGSREVLERETGIPATYWRKDRVRHSASSQEQRGIA